MPTLTISLIISLLPAVVQCTLIQASTSTSTLSSPCEAPTGAICGESYTPMDYHSFIGLDASGDPIHSAQACVETCSEVGGCGWVIYYPDSQCEYWMGSVTADASPVQSNGNFAYDVTCPFCSSSSSSTSTSSTSISTSVSSSSSSEPQTTTTSSPSLSIPLTTSTSLSSSSSSLAPSSTSSSTSISTNLSPSSLSPSPSARALATLYFELR